MGLIRLPDYPWPSLSPANAEDAVKIIHYIYPVLLLMYFLGASCATVCLKQEASISPPRRSLLWLTLGTVITYVLELGSYMLHALVEIRQWPPEHTMFYVITSLIVWGALQISLLDNAQPIWYPYWGAWLIGLFSEIPLTIYPVIFRNAPSTGIFITIQLGVKSLRLAFMVLLPTTFWLFRRTPIILSEESAPLLAQTASSGTYGAVINFSGTEEAESRKEREFRERVKKRREESGGWWGYAKSFLIFWPYIWPHKERRLQLYVVLVGCCLLIERGLNFLNPRQVGKVTDALMEGGSGHLPWKEVTVLMTFRLLTSGAGIPAVQNWLWVPVEQYSYRSITEAAYNHVMNLSCDYHSSKNTGELFSIVAQGRSVNGFVEMLLFSLVPMIGDLFMAFGYFYFVFGIYMAAIVAIVSGVYIWVTAILSKLRSRLRRNYNATARKETQMMWSTMSTWETVTYFNRIKYEQDRYAGAIEGFQVAEREYINGITILNLTQSIVFSVGLLCASLLAVYEVTMGRKKVGDFVALLSYWSQISSPLSFLTGLQRKIQDMMLDAERLFELLLMKPSIINKPDANNIIITNGDVSFENVEFAYDSRKGAIKGMSFYAPGGHTTALVGETGGGKSTTLKLLFRFYDVTEGSVKIDGQDVRDVTLESLREQIGVVPQDPRLFNETIMDNLRYARFNATEEEIHDACRAAAIHDKIMSFPDGYLSLVGENGVKLSGGEKQRVAIARAILKNPRIVLLDEATSSVDVTTERFIQAALQKLAQGRTVFVIAHRLSTIMNADQILVINDGQIIERGKHADLLKLGGKYCELWSRELDNAVRTREYELPSTPKSQDLLVSEESTAPSSTEATTTVVNKDSKRNIPNGCTALNIQFAPLVPTRTEGFRPHTYPKVPISMSAPKLECMRPQKENMVPITPIKTESVLKPDAKEFIPSIIPHTRILSTVGAVDQSSELASFGDGDGRYGGEEMNDQKRRRRYRRRSRSSRNSSGNEQPSGASRSTGTHVGNGDSYIPETVSSTSFTQAGGKRNTQSSIGSELSRAPISLTDAVVPRVIPNPSSSPARTAAAPRFTDPSKFGLYEATPNVPLARKISNSSREGRGGSVPRWKGQGQGRTLLGANPTSGHGMPNTTTSAPPKDMGDANAISMASSQKTQPEKARIVQR